MRAYIQNINITSSGNVVVSGQLPQTNYRAKLTPYVYVQPPEDGIWDYSLEVLPTACCGATVLTPFSVEAPWSGGPNSNGVRIIQSGLKPGDPDYETVQLKVKKVKAFTREQKNIINITGAAYDKTNQQLIIDVKYSGGCFSHSFSLEWNGAILNSMPPQYPFVLVDNSDYDPCLAIIECQLRFNVNTPYVQLKHPSLINLSTLKGMGNRQVKIK